MTQFNITGMSCAACVARVEKAVNSVDGVSACSVSLLTNSMGVEGDIDTQKIISAVEMQVMVQHLKTRQAKHRKMML